MNLILFEKAEIGSVIPGHDPRAKHIRRTLKYTEGDKFEAAIVNGKLGKAKIITLNKKEMVVDFCATKDKTTPYPLTLIVGLTRPQIAKHIFRESASMGIEKLWCYPAELGEKSYLESNFWEEKNYHPQLVKGAGQGFTSNLPEIRIFESLDSVIEEVSDDYGKITLDNVRPIDSISHYSLQKDKAAILLGSERGLTDKERGLLEENNWKMLHMGKRVLRTDTACIAGITLVLSKMGYM